MEVELNLAQGQPGNNDRYDDNDGYHHNHGNVTL